MAAPAPCSPPTSRSSSASPPCQAAEPAAAVMRPLVYFVLLTILSHVGFVGSRITVSLSAINQGASPLEVGVIMSLYAVIPMLLAVQAGRLVDRVGAFRPMAVAGA